MKFFHRFTQWKHLKLKNIILNDENTTLATQNMLLERMNKAYEIENFKSGRKIMALRIEKKNLIEALVLQSGNTASGHEGIDKQTLTKKGIMSFEPEAEILAVGPQMTASEITKRIEETDGGSGEKEVVK